MENVNSLVSVVVPVYKVEKYISSNLQSLINQTYKNFEIILVDDGSPDKSIAIAKELLESSGVNYSIVTQANAGLSAARNAGFDKAKGKWVYFIDSDDVILPRTIECLVNVGEKEDCDFVFSDYKVIADYNDLAVENKQDKIDIFDANRLQRCFLNRKNVVLAPGTLYLREFLIDNGLRFDKLPWSEDQHFMWRVLSCVKKAVYVKQPFYQYLRRVGSIMADTPIEKIITSYQAILELPNFFNEKNKVAKYIVARWVMGTMNSTACMTSPEKWKELFVRLNAKKHFNRLLTFKGFKVKVLALIGIIFPSLYYRFCSGRNVVK